MNKVTLMGRLTRDPEVRYSQSANPIAVAKYGLAVNRRFAKQGEPNVDFFNITAFGRDGEFAEKYLKKGQMIAISGRIQINTIDEPDKGKRTYVDIIVDEQHFAESKSSFEAREGGSYSPTPSTTAAPSNTQNMGGFSAQPIEEDDDLPF
ncbi:MAG: single-stranded DNA-binding protein [Epulopiscium sp. Nele67-Bin004]|nr:MAG: single-stranded DNA-binding protein [Epulopiscium sp. Nele67-Bin004]